MSFKFFSPFRRLILYYALGVANQVLELWSLPNNTMFSSFYPTSRQNFFLISNSDIFKDLRCTHHLFLLEQAKDSITMSLAVFPARVGVGVDLSNISSSIDFSSLLCQGSTCYLLGCNVITHGKPISS